ncbi:hypothetical protein HNQ51_001011 [Inhella inkyongensis]|uniref:DUF3619 family protein n=1 Tax=Inhella inkyongensis TaxID=392593 RepID=A0A840S2T5_9BURK|nr:DUF3619 family protein [Inhella inkyongensis]MBB5203718.1 hypothetical protein [Inhella inkyongensis]
MKPNQTQTSHEQAIDRLGAALAKPLQQQADTLAPEITARLEAARQQALAAARATREASAVQVSGLGQAALSGPGGKRRLGLAWIPALALVLGLALLSQGQWLQQVLGLGEVDTQLLKDQLPPNAYGDPGFNEYLDEEEPKDPAAEPPADEVDSGA